VVPFVVSDAAARLLKTLSQRYCLTDGIWSNVRIAAMLGIA
jgi:hypothetical protein